MTDSESFYGVQVAVTKTQEKPGENVTSHMVADICCVPVRVSGLPIASVLMVTSGIKKLPVGCKGTGTPATNVARIVPTGLSVSVGRKTAFGESVTTRSPETPSTRLPLKAVSNASSLIRPAPPDPPGDPADVPPPPPPPCEARTTPVPAIIGASTTTLGKVPQELCFRGCCSRISLFSPWACGTTSANLRRP